MDYLKQKYGIEGSLHIYLLHQNLCATANDNTRDKESQYANGLVAFEYERLIDKIDRAINVDYQSEFFWKAYHSAQKHFAGYSSESIPAASVYEENILSFLETLGYRREDFIFFPDGKRNFCLNI
jgi:hypothetical protein